MEGGTGQLNTVFSWGTMKESGIVSGGLMLLLINGGIFYDF